MKTTEIKLKVSITLSEIFNHSLMLCMEIASRLILVGTNHSLSILLRCQVDKEVRYMVINTLFEKLHIFILSIESLLI